MNRNDHLLLDFTHKLDFFSQNILFHEAKMIMSKSRIAKTAAPEIFTKCTFVEVKQNRVHSYSFASFDHAIYNICKLEFLRNLLQVSS